MQAATNLSSQTDYGQTAPSAQEPCQRGALSIFGIPVRLSARTITLAFLFFGGCWVLVTSLLPGHLLADAVSTARLYQASGLFFVLLTAALLYHLVQRYATDLSCSSELITRVFEASPSGIAVVREKDHQILLINRQFEALSGYSVADATGRSTLDLKLWANKEERLALINRLRNEELVQGFDASFRHKDGSLFPGVVTARRFTFDREPCTIAFIEDTSQQHQIARQVEELTRYDAMTGLPNQKLLTERLNQMLPISSREGQSMAVLSLALARCPSTISAMGHDGCDELLRCVAMRLRGSLRETDMLAVLQKGEFGILLPKAGSERELLPVVSKLLDSISEPITVAEAEFQLHAHIGIAIFPGDGRTGEVLLQHAHLAMTQAQAQAGENYFQFYAEEMNRIANEQLQVESSILRGIRAGEFFVCYQPIFDREGKRMVGMEALARWQHPVLGLVHPDKFIPISEANGTIIPLGELVMELALRNCQHWRENGYPQLTVAVNVSARQMKDRQFADRVAQLLLLSGLPPEALCCELTESMLMEHSNENTEQIFRLKELGVKLAIDDFGTGYSSLTHLKHLPVDSIKVDRSFVRDLDSNPDDRAIVSAIVAMARSLHLKVVAEGVETPQQHSILQELGCDTMQGFYFGIPMDRSSFERFLREEPPAMVAADLAVPQKPEKTVRQNLQEVQQAQEERPLQKVGDITLKIEPLKPADRLNTALERFQTDKRQQVLPVVDQHRVVGILNRSEFIEEQVVGRIGYAFHINHSKKVRELMQPVPLVIDSEASIEEAASALHGNFGTMRLENICVARRGIYQGVLDVRTLVEAITALNLKLAKGANPLTGLPGNESIQRETNRRLESGMPFDIAYIDIDNFKPYNDFYGFERGDMVIGAVADILKLYADDLLQGPQVRNFCGHIGGDDFIIITGPGHAAGLSRQVISEFNARLPLLHGTDYSKGCYTSFNRNGELDTFSLLSLSVAVICNGQLRISSYPQLASMASEVKKTAKKVKGSSVVVKIDDNPPAVVFDSQIEEP